MSTNSPDVDTKGLSEAAGNDTVNQERRKGFQSFLELMIGLSILAISVLGILLAFPPENVNLNLTKLFLLELAGFFPYTGIFALALSYLKLNKKENSDLILRIIIYNALLWVLTNMAAIYWTSVAG